MQFPIQQKFKLTESFIDTYKDKKPDFGFNGLGEFVYMRTYSRLKDTGKNEAWYETVRRVVEGLYSIQRQHIEDYRLGWNQNKAQKSAQEMYDRIFSFKMLPPGRGLWAMGSPVVMERGLSEALFNCSFISTEKMDGNPGLPFANAMDFLMLGVGVGADTLGAGTLTIQSQKEKEHSYQIPDTREGWVESVRLLINSYFGEPKYIFDYSLIRKEGEPIRTFGGVSSGPRPLIELHNTINTVLSADVSKPISVRNIADIMNAIGKAVVSGNVRRSAEILLGKANDEFLDLKNYDKNPERADFGWASNNTIYATTGMDYAPLVERIKRNGEPGLFWLENARKYGRVRDSESGYKDKRVTGLNPCAEITLESGELCVSGDTRILTQTGYPKISTVIGQTINVWNGDDWSPVVPRKTGENMKLLRVTFTDGSHLDCTPYHRFSIETSRNAGKAHFKEVEAQNLKVGDTLENSMVSPENLLGMKEENSFEWGFFAGNGYLDDGSINAVICGDKNKLLSLGLKGTPGLPQIKKGYKDPVNRLYLTKILKDVELAKNLNDKSIGIPEYFFNLDYVSTLNFLAGWIETDGSIQKNKNTWNYRIYGSKEKMLDIQLLLKRLGFTGVSVSLASKKGFKTNFGERNQDLYYVTIPSNQCYKIPTRYKIIPDMYIGKSKRKNNAHGISKDVSIIRRQNVASVDVIDELQDTYCFTETKNHKAVFGNVLTHQCNLCEMFPFRHTDLDDFKKTIKYAYLAAKTVTLLNTGWAETNRVMLRNRRIGLSMTGIAQFLSRRSLSELKEWMREGYNTAESYDAIYSDWFAIPRSIKLTTIKPSGTVSLLAGATPGIHFPESNYYIRRVRLSANSPFVGILRNSHYNVEPAKEDPQNTMVVEFPISLGEDVKTIDDVTMWEQLNLAVFTQENWADNSVSVTVTFKEEEGKDIATALNFFQFKLKAVSFLPKVEEGAYAQMPYEKITKEEYTKRSSNLLPLDFSELTSESIGEKYCDGDMCTI
jgi:ribonucleotide reductase alpha subunit